MFQVPNDYSNKDQWPDAKLLNQLKHYRDNSQMAGVDAHIQAITLEINASRPHLIEKLIEDAEGRRRK
jgi:hypothetical protein